jgi:hypothetical protein
MNRQKDPQALNNLIDDPVYEDVVGDLRKEVEARKRWNNRAGETGRKTRLF